MLIFFVLLVEGTRRFLKIVEIANCPHRRSHPSLDWPVRINSTYEWETVDDLVDFRFINFRVTVKEDFWPVELLAGGNDSGLGWLNLLRFVWN